jgi:nicotinate-nucleotide pyrophosphorylase (carboxylating)
MDYRAFAARAVDEDLGPGDLTTESTIPVEWVGSGRVLAKQDLVVCGHDLAAAIFDDVGRRYGAVAHYEPLLPDGTQVKKGTYIADIKGSLRVIIVGERPALNSLMKLCGIATHTRSFVDVAGDGLRVVDTRKTTPLWRDLEKYAVRCGGAHNHRRGLYDGVMIKDNHICAVGSMTEAVRRVRENVHHLVRIEVEARTLDEVDEALSTDAEVILLDNMDDDMLREAVARARATRPVLLEASGNMNAERVARLAEIGVDIVSAGALIHQARWVDLSLKVSR